MVVGTPTEEPNPLPTGYDTGLSDNPDAATGSRCTRRTLSLWSSSRPGRLPYSLTSQAERHAYDVPIRSQVHVSDFDMESCASGQLAATPPTPQGSRAATLIATRPASAPSVFSPGYVWIHNTIVTVRANGTVDDFGEAAQFSSRMQRLFVGRPCSSECGRRAASVTITIQIESQSDAETTASSTLTTALGMYRLVSVGIAGVGLAAIEDFERGPRARKSMTRSAMRSQIIRLITLGVLGGGVLCAVLYTKYCPRRT